MLIDAAKQGGVLAASIDVRNVQIDAINTAIAQDWRISSCRARNPETGEILELVLDNLDSATSQQSLEFILAIYQAQLTTLNSELAAL